MTKTKLILLTVFAFANLALSASTSATQNAFRFFAPSKFGKMLKLDVAGKGSEYYLLEDAEQIEIHVTGPCQLKVISRPVVPSQKETVRYQFYATQKEGSKSFSFLHESRYAATVSPKDSSGVLVGAGQSRIVDVPAGQQIYTFSLPKDSKEKVYLRFGRTWNKVEKKKPAPAMTPVEFSSQVELLSAEKVRQYYRIGHGDRVVLKVIGPITLKGFCRIEFDESMTGEQKWRLQVLEDKAVKATYPLAAKKSQTATYREKSPLVPSGAEVFFVEVPAGEHLYEFNLPENHRTVLLRFLVPATNGEKE